MEDYKNRLKRMRRREDWNDAVACGCLCILAVIMAWVFLSTLADSLPP